MAGFAVARVSRKAISSKVNVEALFAWPTASSPLKYTIFRPLLLGYIPFGPVGCRYPLYSELNFFFWLKSYLLWEDTI